jgi:N-acetylglucosaminyldiphosphoundecaprenol N-acetyl-beta-D-mannosaminyltransferase
LHPRVSVILNCRNGADYLNQAIDSLLAQTFEDWELVAWDDGSTDDTHFIVKAYSDNRIRLFSAPASGSLSKVRSLAIQKCQGDWLAFLDQDDVWLPEKLARQVEVAERYPESGLIYGRGIRFRGKSAFRDYDHRHEWSPLPEGQIFDRLLIDSCFICMSSAMVRRSALAHIDPIPAHVRLAPDYYLYLALALRFPARAVQEPVCFYREHENSLSCQSGRELQFECIRLINQFSPWMNPNLARWRRLVHNSLIGFADICHLATFGRGIDHLLDVGSFRYLASRPFARCYRLVKRWFVRPYWKAAWSGTDTVSVGPPPTGAALSAPRSVPKRFELLGTEISIASFVSAQNFLASMVDQRVPGYICNANTYSVMYSRDVDRHKRVVSGASFVNADGMPIVWILRALGLPAERVHGDDLFFACCERFPEWGHFLVGGREGQGKLVADELRRRYPGIKVVGFRSTPTRPPSAEETTSILQEIREAKPSIIWVGMGTPSQDFWMSYATSLTGVPMAGVGSSFDILAGYTQPAPEWMKRHGLQWLFRVFQEPRRLAWRYFYNNSRFFLAVAIESIRLVRHSIRVTRAGGLRLE